MSTRSRIGVALPRNGVISIYCHFDGYLEGVGDTLRTSYNDLAKIEELIKLGDISSLGAEVNPPAGAVHTHASRTENVTVAYGRDRGDKGTKAIVHDSIEQWLESGEEYAYLWDKDHWRVWCLHEGSTIQGGGLTSEMIAEAIAGDE